MSQRREQLEERLPDFGPALDRIGAIYHLPVLLALLAFMFWIRVRNWQNYLVDGEVYFNGNDAWYHLRQVSYTVRHWPQTMPFDPWTSFPTGTSVGQFGTLYDQLVATVALAIGLGSPTDHTVALTLLFAPAVLGTLVAIPTYFLGKRFGGRFGGLVGVAILALSPSTFLGRSIAGFSDHHAAETFFQVLAVAVIIVALSIAEREKPVYEQFTERDFDNLRRPVGWAILAGVAITLYVWAWPPGLLLVGIFGIFLLVALPLEYLRGESPEHVAIVSAIALSVAGFAFLVSFNTLDVSVTNFSLLHPGLAFAGVLGCVFMAWLARAVERRDLPVLAYPGIILGLFVLGALVMALVVPDFFAFFVGQLERVVGFGSTATSLTVAEAQPPTQPVSFLLSSYGLAFVTALAGAALLVLRLAVGRNTERAASLFILIWAAFMTAATLTQARFNYYLIVPIAVLNAFFVGQVLRYIGSTDARSTLRNLELYQVLVMLAMVVLITAPLAAGGSGGALTAAGGYADGSSTPGSSVTGWDGSLEWMANNTPAEGTYGGANAEMDYYGNYDRTDDFDYPNGAYGVLSWWDYGHWITVLGERIPTANPFQQNAHQAANFLLADNESRANEIARMPDGEGARYVMVDWKMADPAGGGLFSAPFSWYNDGPLSIYQDVTPVARQSSQGTQTILLAYEQRHYETMRTRLYNYHGSAVEPGPVVLDYTTSQGGPDGSTQALFVQSSNESPVRRFANMSAARAFVEQDGTAQLGGVGSYPQERVPALEHYRLVRASQKNAIGGPQGYGPLAQSAIQQLQATGLNASELYGTTTNWVKTFERVPGATVEGTGPPNTTVEATVEMQMPTTNNTTFEYTQQARTDAQGRFTMTLPYSTTGYEQWGTERGATNVSVRATGPYTFQTPAKGSNENATRWNASAAVPEGNVIGRNDGPIRVELQRESVSTPNSTASGSGPTNATNVSTGAGSASDGNATGGNASAVGLPDDSSVGADPLTQARVAR